MTTTAAAPRTHRPRTTPTTTPPPAREAPAPRLSVADAAAARARAKADATRGALAELWQLAERVAIHKDAEDGERVFALAEAGGIELADVPRVWADWLQRAAERDTLACSANEADELMKSMEAAKLAVRELNASKIPAARAIVAAETLVKRSIGATKYRPGATSADGAARAKAAVAAAEQRVAEARRAAAVIDADLVTANATFRAQRDRWAAAHARSIRYRELVPAALRES